MGPNEPSGRAIALGFLTGAITALMIAALCVGALVWKIGVGKSAANVQELLRAEFSPDRGIIDLPPDVLEEMRALPAALSNAHDLGAPDEKRDRLLVDSHGRFGRVLRPNARVRGHQLRALNPLNLNPPMIYLRANAPISPRFARFLEDETRLLFEYTIDAHGNRLTLPAVESPDRIVVVGDSVAFGVGVGDEETAASVLQRALGASARVVNAGVGAYSAAQALGRARDFAESGGGRALVYLTSLNDFSSNLAGEKRTKAWVENAREILAGFAELRGAFGDQIVVLVAGHVELAMHELLQQHGWSAKRIARVAELYRELPEIAASLGLGYVDWTRLTADHIEASGTTFSPFDLYVDHAHLSPLGNRLVAQRIHAVLAASEP